ncbi:MAG: DUF2341 domain-containing protein, partial [Candidatus Aureabacteria bacterium]|nr:DUF2341 domain-containing protein [Candidatus Auribacterota bacterium]
TNGTLPQGSNTITAGSLNQSGGTFTGGSSNITVSGNFTLSGGTFTSTQATLAVGGNWSDVNDTFTHNSGTVDFNGSGTQSITIGFKPFYNLIHSGSGTVTLSPAWSYRKQITISSSMVSNTDQTDFPVLIYRASDSDLASNAQADGDDIIFTLSNGTKLSHEIEKYTSATGELYVWVKVPTLSASSDTTFYMYYGNATCSSQEDVTGVWNSNYKGVWHLDEEQAGTGTANLYQDSTLNNNDGDDYISATGQTGQVDGGQQFDGSNDYITVSGLTWTPTNFSVAWWHYPLTRTNYNQQIIANNAWGAFVFHTTATGGVYVGTDQTNRLTPTQLPAGTVELNKWQHFVFKYGGTTGFFYKNGALVGSKTMNSATAWGGFRMGVNHTNTINGYIDEVRVSNTARSVDWIATSYNNQNDPASYETVGTQSGGLLTVTNNLTQSAGTFDIDDNTLNVSGNVLVTGGTLDASDASCDLDIGGNVTVSSGTLSAPTALDDTSFTAAGNWEISGTGIFTPNAGRVLLDASSTGKTITTSSSGADDFYDVKFNNSSGGWILQDDLIVSNDLTLTNGTLDTSISNLTAAGNALINGGTLDASDASCDLDIGGNLTVSSGTLSAPTALDDTSFTAAGNWEISGTGIFTPNAGRVLLDASSTGKTITTSSFGTDDFYDVKFNNSSGGWTLQDDLIVSNDLTLTNGTLDTSISNLTAAGNTLINGGTLDASDASCDLDINGNVTVSSGTLSAPTALDDTSFTAAGNWEISGTGIFTPNAGRVLLDASSTGKTITTSSSGTDDFYDAKFNNSSGGWTLQDDLTITNDLTLTNGTLDTSISNLTVTGNTLINGGILDASDASCDLDIGGNLTVSSGTLSAPAALDDTSFTAGG